MYHHTSELLRQRSFLTAGGTETYLLFQQQFPMREFCAFEIFEHQDHLQRLEADYLVPLMSSVAQFDHGLLLDALVWRAHPDFVAALGYPPSALRRLNEQAVARTKACVSAWRRRSGYDATRFPVLITADIGPRGDGYRVDDGVPSADEAFEYHSVQMEALKSADVDVVCALTMTNANEAIGIVRAAALLDVPVIVSATVETNGRLPDGSALGEFIRRVDEATASPPLYHMVNCAHPSHLAPTLESAAAAGEDWLARFKGLRANSSKKSHEELDNSTELDRGDPSALAAEIAALSNAFDLRIVGGCCGTDHEHIAEISKAVARAPAAGTNAA